MTARLTIIPVTFRMATEFVGRHHRHHKRPAGCKFCLGVCDVDGVLRGVAMVGRPVARHLDDGLTAEVNRTCTDGFPNANSALYAAAWRTASAMGYRRLVTYTQEGESGASLTAAGWVRVRDLPARKGWACGLVARLRSGVGTVHGEMLAMISALAGILVKVIESDPQELTAGRPLGLGGDSGEGEASHPAMPPRRDPSRTSLGQYIDMRIVAVTEHGDGAVVLEVGPIGYMSRRRVLLEGVTRVTDITEDRPAWSDGDEAQAQQDLGDDMYEREREERE